MGFASLASEFPNDNAEISSGAVWICQSLTGPATLQAPAFEPVPAIPFVFWFEDDDVYCDGPVDIEVNEGGLNIAVHPVSAEAPPVALDDDHAPVGEDEPPSADADAPVADADADADAPVVLETPPEAPVAPAFAHFEQALTAALLAQGASRSAAILPKMLRLEALPGEALTKDVQLTLQSRGYVDGSGRYSQKFRDLCGAWCAVLQGSSQDFAACGTTTLDCFGADLLAALLAVPATRSDELRRELRRAGVAAFGILEAA